MYIVYKGTYTTNMKLKSILEVLLLCASMVCIANALQCPSQSLLHEPPRGCHNIVAKSIKETNVTVMWERPINSDNISYYYSIEYNARDGESAGSDIIFSQEKIVQYSIGGLKPAKDYIIAVSVESEVYKDIHNKQLTRCELSISTKETRKKLLSYVF